MVRLSEPMLLLRPTTTAGLSARAGRCTMFVPDDRAVVATAAVLMIAAGTLQYTVTKGDRGLGAFLSKEKSSNPFYTNPTFTPDPPSPPPVWLQALRPSSTARSEAQQRPDAFSRGSTSGNERERLYAKLDAAVEAEDYELASQIKAQIDKAPDEKSGGR